MGEAELSDAELDAWRTPQERADREFLARASDAIAGLDDPTPWQVARALRRAGFTELEVHQYCQRMAAGLRAKAKHLLADAAKYDRASLARGGGK
jgi:hypothetical protein